MRKINAFNFVSVNGFYKDMDDDISWHKHSPEQEAFSRQQLQSDNILLFGRITYEMMFSFWTSQNAWALYPETAKGMNAAEKICISNKLKNAAWQNTVILSGHIIDKIRQLKNTEGKNLTILGSGSIVTQLADAGLIDEYGMMIDPLAIGHGTPLFDGLYHPLNLTLKDVRVFENNGVVLLTYEKSIAP